MEVTHRPSRTTYRTNVCGGSSVRSQAVIRFPGRSASAARSPDTISSPTRPSPDSTWCPATTCSSTCVPKFRSRFWQPFIKRLSRVASLRSPAPRMAANCSRRLASPSTESLPSAPELLEWMAPLRPGRRTLRPFPLRARQIRLWSAHDPSQWEFERALLEQYAPPAVLVDEDLEILQFRGGTGAFLEPAAGKATLNLIRMSKESIRAELQSLLYRARQHDRTVRSEGFEFSHDGQRGTT